MQQVVKAVDEQGQQGLKEHLRWPWQCCCAVGRQTDQLTGWKQANELTEQLAKINSTDM